MLQRLVVRLRQNGFLVDDFVSGSTKYMGVCRLPDSGGGGGDSISFGAADLLLLQCGISPTMERESRQTDSVGTG